MLGTDVLQELSFKFVQLVPRLLLFFLLFVDPRRILPYPGLYYIFDFHFESPGLLLDLRCEEAFSFHLQLDGTRLEVVRQFLLGSPEFLLVIP